MRTLVFSVFIISSLSLISYSHAADIQGVFYLVPQKSANVTRIEDSVLSKMNALIRPFAIQKLNRAAEVHNKLSIVLSGKYIRVVAGNDVLPITNTDGTLVMYRNREGDLVSLQTHLQGNTLEQTFSTNNGSRTNYCKLSNDGTTLKMHVIIRSEYFDRPMVYTLVYDKTPHSPEG
ncbi:MAG: hypothetical protein ACP5SH_19145 [Syntrophobacteraceae bacterium]